MPKNKLKKFKILPDIILKIINKDSMSTFAIKNKVIEKIPTTWKTVERYLTDLEKEGKIKSTKFKDNNITIWSIS